METEETNPPIKPIVVQPLFNASDEEWVMPIGQYILNMGAVEFATRLLIERIEGTIHSTPVSSAALSVRIAFIRKRFPRYNKVRHKWAMNALKVAAQHVDFRNIIAHSPLIFTGHADGSHHILGILNVTTNEAVSILELKGRVDESAMVARRLLEMQSDFPTAEGG